VRIIAGSARGRRLVAPRGQGTRPFTGRVKEAVFSSLGGAVTDAAVLDAYAGTGSLGLEAASRGAASVVFLERDGAALEALERNVAAVGLGGTIRRGDAARTLAVDLGSYDIVFVDPPYAAANAEVEAFLAALDRRLARDAVVIVHRRFGTPLPQAPPFLRLTDRRRYGDAEVLRFTEEQP
jgi:16S rRNA (guanine966-N2)-methyltransferase